MSKGKPACYLLERDGGLVLHENLSCLSLPTYLIFAVLWLGFPAYLWLRSGGAGPGDPPRALPDWGWPWVRDLTVLLFAPNVLRQACLDGPLP